MRSRLIRALVDALGERGDISLPIVPQLVPTIPVTDMAKIGFPVGIPVQATYLIGGSVGERGSIVFRAPKGYVIRIDRVQGTTTAYGLYYGRVPGDPSSNTAWCIVDGRFGMQGLIGVLIGIWSAARSYAAVILPQVTNGFGRFVASLVTAGQWTEGPWYVNDDYALQLFGEVDNSALTVTAVGEAFELG